MAKMEFTQGGGQKFTPHPTGTFEGVVEEVLLAESVTFTDSKTGEKNVSYPRQLIIRNTDGKAPYTFTDRESGEDITGACTVRSRPHYFYSNGEGGFYKPTDKSNLYQYYQAVMGGVPDFDDFDDESVLGTRLMYSIIHVDAEDKDDPEKVFANLSGPPMRHPDQSGNFETVTQAQRAAFNAESDNGNGKPQTQTGEGEADITDEIDYKESCETWIGYLANHNVYDDETATKYHSWLKTGKTEDMKRFLDKAKSDCQAAGVALPSPDPMSTGDDDIPF